MEILAGAEVDLFIPSFPELQALFNLSPFMVQLTLSVNFFSYCLSSLWAGSLGDRYGRKPVALAGLVIFSLGSAFCSLAPSFPWLLWGRFLQGMGIAGPAVLAYVFVSDWYTLRQQQKMMGILNGVTALAMALAPVLGSYISLFFGWRGNFHILLFLGIFCTVLTWIWVPSSQPDKAVSLSLKGYFPILQSSDALIYLAAGCLLCVTWWVFIGMAPILYMEDLGVSLSSFGYYQGVMASVFGFVSLISGWFLKNFGQKKCFQGGVFLCVVSFVGIALLMVYESQSPLLITGIMALFASGIVLPINILYPLYLEIFPNLKGMMAALFSFFRLVLTALGLEIAGYFYQGTFHSVAVILLICLGLSFYTIFLLERTSSFKKSIA
jgi:DHA1 family bicyclomycin/chloramphenicol resistance-like MFS transporter